MDALADSFPGCGVILETSLESEFNARLADSSTLAYRVALGVLHNSHDAEDVAQEAFVKAYRSFHRLRDRDRFRAWLARIVWRLALDRLRAAGRRERWERLAVAPAAPPSVEDIAASHEFQKRLEAAVDRLPEKLRTVVVLAAMQGHDHDEVARLLGLPKGTIKSRLFKARRKLAEILR